MHSGKNKLTSNNKLIIPLIHLTEKLKSSWMKLSFLKYSIYKIRFSCVLMIAAGTVPYDSIL